MGYNLEQSTDYVNKDENIIKCKYCDNTGMFWKGGQGGDYEYCECEKGKAKKQENDNRPKK